MVPESPSSVHDAFKPDQARRKENSSLCGYQYNPHPFGTQSEETSKRLGRCVLLIKFPS